MKTRIPATLAKDFLRIYLPALRKNAQVEIAGSLRRGSEEVGDIDLVVIPKDRRLFEEAVMKIEDTCLAWGEKKIRIETKEGIQIDFQMATPETFESMMLYLTGSAKFNIMCRGIAKKQGMRLNEYGLFRGGKNVASSEEQILKILGLLEFLSPVKREL